MRRKLARVAVPVMECVVTMPGTLTLTSPWEAGIEKNAYLAYVVAEWTGYVVTTCLLLTAGERGAWALCRSWVQADQADVDFACPLL
jgi:hypothetical protein